MKSGENARAAMANVPSIVVVHYRHGMSKQGHHLRQNLKLIYGLREVVDFVDDQNIQRIGYKPAEIRS